MKCKQQALRLNLRLKPIVVAVAAALASTAAQPIAVVWTNPISGNWSLAGNWSPAAAPLGGDDVTINLPQTLTVTYSAGSVALNSLTLGSATNTLALTGGTFGAGTLSSLGVINVNNTTLNITGGSTALMNLNAASVTNLSGTLALSSFLNLAGGVLNGGTIQQAGANRLAFSNATNTLSGVTVRGDLSVALSNGNAGGLLVTNGLTVLSEAGGSPGVINVGVTGSGSRLGFSGNQSFDNATINLGSATTTGNIGLENGGTLTLGANAIVRGSGQVGTFRFAGATGSLVNNGLMHANLSADTLTINSNALTNNGILRASGGGILTIAPIGSFSNAGTIHLADAASTVNLNGSFTTAALGTVSNTAGGALNLLGALNNTGNTLTLSPATTGSLRLDTGSISGGTIQFGGGAGLHFSAADTNVLDGVTIRGTLVVAERNGTGGDVRISNGLTMLTEAGAAAGVINAIANNSSIGFTGTQSFNNATINLGSATTAGRISLDGGGTLTLGAGAVVQGRGEVGRFEFAGPTGSLVNNGLISANVSGQTLTVNPLNFTNNATIRALGGGELTLSPTGTWANTGTAEASTGGVLNIAPALPWSNSGVIRLVDAASTVNLDGSFTTAGLGTVDNAAGGALNLLGALNNTGNTLTLSPATTGSLWLFNSSITGGTIQFLGGAGLHFSGADANVLDAVTIRGTLVVAERNGTGGDVRISNGLTMLTEAGAAAGVINVVANNSSIGFTGTQSFNNATINLGSATAVGRISLDGGGTLTLGAGAVVQGRGEVGRFEFAGPTGSLVNNGLISANVSGQTLTVNPLNFTNNGSLRAISGGTLTIAPTGAWSNAGTIQVVDATSTVNLGGTFTTAGAGSYTNSAGGTLNLDGTLNNAGNTLSFSPTTGAMQMTGGTVNGGSLQFDGANTMQFSVGTNTFNGVTVRGTLNVVSRAGTNGHLLISNGLTVLSEGGASPGVVNLTPTGVNASRLGFAGNQTFDNATVNLDSGASGSTLSAENGTLTLGSNLVVQGKGRIDSGNFIAGTGNVVNNGVIRANVSGALLDIFGNGSFTNNATVEALQGATMRINPTGAITNLVAGTLSGGIWRADAGGGAFGRIDITKLDTVITTNAADIYLVGANSSFQARDAGNVVRTLDATLTTNSGALRLQQGRNFTAAGGGGNFINTGNLELTDSTFTSTSLASDGVITSFGNATVTTAVGNRVSGNGQINASFAPLTITRGVNMGATSGMTINPGATINLSGAAIASQIGTLAMNGALNLGTQNIVVLSDYNNASFGVGNAFNARSGVTGAGLILGDLAAQTITGNVIPGAANQFTLNMGAIRGGNNGTLNFQIANSGTGAAVRGALTTSNIDARLSGAGVTASNFGAITAGGNSGNLGVTLTAGNVGGPITGTLQVASNFSNVATQTITLSGLTSVLAVGNAAPSPLNLGNFRVAAAGTASSLAASNTTSGAGAEQLGINSATASAGFTASNVLGAALIAPGATQPGAVTVAANGSGVAGANLGTLNIQYATDGSNIDAAFTRQNANLQVINLQATGFNAAAGSAAPAGPVNLGNVRVGGTLSQLFTVTNTAAPGSFSEDLNANFSANTGDASHNGGGITGLLAGASNGAAMAAVFSTASAGAKTGTVTLSYQTAGAVGGVSNGLGTAAAGSQIVALSGNVFQVAQPTLASNNINLGNVRAIAGAGGFINLTNTSVAVAGFQEGLAASFSGSTGGVLTAGSLTNLAQGGNNSNTLGVSFAAGAAGAKTGTATVALTSTGAGTSGLADLALASQVVNVNANFFRLATGGATPDPVNFGNLRVNAAASQLLTVSNTAANDSFSERLNASFSGNTGSTLTTAGAITQLLPGVSNNAAMSLALNTATAGAKSGTVTLAYASDGTGTTGAAPLANGNQAINFSGGVYNMAVGNTTPTPVLIANQRVGGSLAQLLTVSNTAAAGAFSEDLAASFAAPTGNATHNAGTIASVLAGANNAAAMSVGVNTASAGLRTGTVTLNYQTNAAVGGVAVNGLSAISAGNQVINVSGNVYQLAAGQINTAALNFGTVQVGQAVSQSLVIGNIAAGAAGFVEDLNAAFGTSSDARITGAGSLSGILAGTASTGANGAMTVGVNTSAAGVVNGSIRLNFTSAGAVAGVNNNLGTLGVGFADHAVAGSIVANVIDTANPLINSGPINLGNVRIGAASPSALVSVTNVASGNSQAALNATIVGNAPITASGSFNLLLPGLTNAGSLSVGMNTAAAGAVNSTATLNFVSDASNVGGCAPNCQLNLASQNVIVTGGVYQVAQPTLAATTINLGNVRAIAGAAGFISLTNTSAAPASFQEGLAASFSSSTGGVLTVGSLANLAQSGSNSNTLGVSFAAGSAGAKAGTATLALTSVGAGTSGLSDLALAPQVVNVAANFFRLATGGATPDPVNFGNLRVSAAASQLLTVSNTAANDSFSERLNASFSGSTGSALTTAGAITQLLPDASNNTNMSLALNTASAGAKSGTVTLAYASDGTGTTGAAPLANGNQVINFSGGVYNPAVGSTTPAPVLIANQRVGGTGAVLLNVSNAAAAGAFSEDLAASFGAATGDATHNAGTIASVLGGANNAAAMSVGLNTNSAGAKSGSVTLNYQTNATVNGVAISGLAATSAGNQLLNVSGNVYQVAQPTLSATSINLGNVRAINGGSGFLTLSNTSAAPNGFQEGLAASFSSSTGGVLTVGSLANLAQSGSNSNTLGVSFAAGSAGAKAGTATLALTSVGAGTSGLADLPLTSQVVNVSANFFRLATGAATPDPVNFGNLRVNAAASQLLTVSNTAANDSFSERLNASFSGSTGSALTTAGAITQLLPGASNNTNMSLALNTATSGAKSGTVTLAYASDGAGTTGAAPLANGNQVLNFNGAVYNMAVGSTTPSPVVIANQRVGGSLAQLLTVANTAAGGAFSEDLAASFGANSGAATHNAGSIATVLVGANNASAMSVGVNTATAGAKSGSVTVNYQTNAAVNGVAINGLSAISAGNQVVNVSGNVYQLAAGSIISAPLNFGTVQVGQAVSQSLVIGNTAVDAAGFVEDLNASFGASSGTGAALISGSGSLSNILAGTSSTAANGVMTVSVNTAAPGSVNGNIAVNFTSAGAVNSVSNALGTLGVGSAAYGVLGTIAANVINTASPQINNSPINLGNVRVGAASPSALVSVTNLATVAPQAALNATITGNAPITAAGSFNLLLPGATNNAGLSVGMNTANAGAINGTATLSFVSDASNVGGCAPDCSFNLPSQNLSVTGGVYQVAQPTLSATTINLGNVRAINGGSGFLTLSNTSAAPNGFQEGLAASFSGSTGGVLTVGSLANLAQSGSNSNTLGVSFAAGTAGAKAGTATLALTSVGAGTSGLSDLPLAPQVVNVNANFFRLAEGSATPSPINFGNLRVGGNTQQLLNVTNTAAADGFSERLNVAFNGSTGSPVTLTGVVDQLLPGASNGAAMQVVLNTASAGAKSGTVTLAYASDGTGTTGGAPLANGNQVINFSGGVYQLAAGQINTAALNFGTVQVGQAVSQSLVIGNTASGAAGFVEDLSAAFGTSTDARISGAGSLAGILAGTASTGANGTMTVGVNTGAAGVVNGSIRVNFTSAGAVAGVTNNLGTLGAGFNDYGVAGSIAANVIDTARPVTNGVLSPGAVAINLGNVRINAAANQALSVLNQTTGNSQAALNASIASNGAPITVSGSFNLLTPGSTNGASLLVGMDTSSAGAKSGSATISFVSDASNVGGCAPNCQLSLASQSVNVAGNVYRLANPSLNTGVVNLVTRVGDAVSANQNVSITHTSPDLFTEGLKVTLSGTTGNAQGAGSIANLAAQANDSTSIRVGLASSAVAGLSSGQVNLAFISTGAGTTGGAEVPAQVAAGSVTVNGKAYTPATASLSTPTLNFGVVRVGDVVSDRLASVNNIAAATALNDTLQATMSGVAGPFTGGGQVSGIGAQSSGQIAVGLNTASAGVYNVSANMAFLSQNPEMADASAGAHAGVNLLAQINNLANADFDLLSGLGGLTQNGSNYVLDLGNITLGSSISSLLGIDNDTLGPADLLSGLFDASAVNDFVLSGWNAINNLGAGEQVGTLALSYFAASLGLYEDTVVFNGRGTNASDPAGLAQTRNLIIRANVIDPNGNPVPEPGMLALLLAAAVAGVIARRRRLH